MKEIWKDIYFEDKGKIYDYVGQYQISNLGNIRSLDRKIFCKVFTGNGSERINGSRLIKGQEIKKHQCKNGYVSVCLLKNNKNKWHRVHRLVAKMFIPNLKNKPQVNHIDGIKTNNCVNNLEWCTAKENSQHSYKTGLHRDNHILLKDVYEKAKKYIIQYSKNGEIIREYHGLKETEKYGFHSCSVSRACRHERKTYLGYIWRYKEDVL